ncbi:hypothetical protein L2X98_23125 [Microbacterium elymi]|uniref:Uncharacterized protein n=1 Tax=Microbacterium elymi TaxID=2909587 RepID=A0ABY5NLE8_9MICO|nr:hypothetical protein [Microbacterium elymi]UUT36003.1 hypothetical protein L2X98_23125 [Microbacterium elymi]
MRERILDPELFACPHKSTRSAETEVRAQAHGAQARHRARQQISAALELRLQKALVEGRVVCDEGTPVQQGREVGGDVIERWGGEDFRSADAVDVPAARGRVLG